jgi:hypothetical protein
MSFESLLNDALNQTFNDEYTRITNRPLGNSEAKNIDDVFQTITNIEECLICCDDDKICIKCFQCTAFYCKSCLIKIASDFNKCSTCNISIKDNYKKLKVYNEELQDTLYYEKAIANSLNEYISISAQTKPERPARPIHLKLKNASQKSSNNNSTNYKNEKENKNSKNSKNSKNDDSESNSESESESDSNSDSDVKDNKDKHNNNAKNKPARKNANNNAKGNLKPSLMNMFKSNKNKKNKKNEDDENNESYNNTSNIIDRKKSYLEDLRNDKIYNITFNSFVNEISPNKPNYTYEWNHTDKTLNFYALCNNNNDFINIVVNYNILKATFQSVLYVWLNEIVKCSFHIFKTKWNNIAIKINHLSTKSEDDITVKEIKKFTKEIVNICKN